MRSATKAVSTDPPMIEPTAIPALVPAEKFLFALSLSEGADVELEPEDGEEEEAGNGGFSNCSVVTLKHGAVILKSEGSTKTY